MASSQPTPPMYRKKQVYLCCSVLLCFLLLTILYEISITTYINYTLTHNSIPTQVALFKIVWFLGGVGSIFGGIALGKYRWRIVYIEKRHWKYYFKHFSSPK